MPGLWNRKYVVFISHTNGSKSGRIVKELASALNHNGITPYVAEEDKQPGIYLCDKIKLNILMSDLIVIVWTEDASYSSYVNQELGWADDKRPCILFVQKGVPVKGFFEGKEHIEFDISNPSDGIAALMECVTKLRICSIAGVQEHVPPRPHDVFPLT